MIRNFRDLSVYRNTAGRHLPKGQFLRSAALSDLKQRDIAFLGQYGPLTVIDLRTDMERKEKPDHRFEAYHAISLLDTAAAGISHDRESDKTMELELPDMEKLYAGLIASDYSIEQIRQVFQVICHSDRQGAVLWHCTEGKDRCGLISALFLKLIDFEDAVILEDYLKSMRSSWKKASYYYFMIRFIRRNPTMAAAVKDAYMVKREYLEASFREIEKRYGSFDGFFEEIGITRQVKTEMQQRFLKP